MSKMQSIITSKLGPLCSATNCDQVLLTTLVIHGVIPTGTKGSLLSQTDPLTRSFELYDFLRKAGSDKDLDAVMQALETTGNKAAYEIFSKGHTPGQGQGNDHGQHQEHSAVDAPSSIKVAQAQSIFPEYLNTGRKKALIINVLKNRRGAEKDTSALEGTLQRCGFEVDLCKSYTERGILQTVAAFKEDLSGVTCIIVAVMSHGTSAYEFLTEDDCELHLKKDIVHAFNNAKCRELRNMPKIFLANFCRGDRVDTGTDWGHPVPERKTETDSKTSFVETDSTGAFSDILICHGTYDEHYAYRTHEGTWFIQSLCKILQTHADGGLDFIDIMKLVFKEVNEKETEDGGKQCPPFEIIGFYNKLYLKYE